MITTAYNFLLGESTPNKWAYPEQIGKLTYYSLGSDYYYEKTKENLYTVNTKTRDIYLRKSDGDLSPEAVIRSLALRCIPGFFFYGSLFAIWHAARIPFDILRISFATLHTTADLYSQKKYAEIGLHVFYKKPIEIVYRGVYLNLYNLAKDPYYTIRLIFASAMTYLAPSDRLLDAKEEIARLEHLWHNKVSEKNDIRYNLKELSRALKKIQNKEVRTGFKELWEGLKKTEVVYFAWCFQITENLNTKDEYDNFLYKIPEKPILEEFKTTRKASFTPGPKS